MNKATLSGLLLALVCAACSAVNENTDASEDTGSIDSSEDPLLAAADYDSTSSFSRSHYSSLTLQLGESLQKSPGRNNSFQTIVLTYRTAAQPIATRTPIANLGATGIVNTGLKVATGNYYSATTKFTLPSTKLAANTTYYIYAQFTSNGGDQLTSIYKLVVTA